MRHVFDLSFIRGNISLNFVAFQASHVLKTKEYERLSCFSNETFTSRIKKHFK